MRVLICGDAVVASGFARCTHAAADALHEAGHEVHVLGINYFGDPTGHPYPIYPARNPIAGGRDAFGVMRLPRLVESIRPDLVVLLNDPWNVPGYFEYVRDFNEARARAGGPAVDLPPVVGWLAVDGKNQRGDGCNELAHVVCWTDFGVDELRMGGYEGSASVVPLGVDPDLFHPRDRMASRRMVSRSPEFPDGFGPDDFVVGVVGRNQPRKRLDLAVEAFATWIHRYSIDNAYLYLHVAPTGDMGVDLRSLIVYHGLQGRVALSEPPIGTGVAEELLPHLYSAFDVLLTTTQGEGWGLTTHEAMACGLPCIVPDWSALGEWPGDAVVKVPCIGTAPTAPLNGLAYTLGGIVDVEDVVDELQNLRRNPELRAEIGEAARERATRPEFLWKNVGAAMREVLEAVHFDHSEEVRRAS